MKIDVTVQVTSEELGFDKEKAMQLATDFAELAARTGCNIFELSSAVAVLQKTLYSSFGMLAVHPDICQAISDMKSEED